MTIRPKVRIPLLAAALAAASVATAWAAYELQNSTYVPAPAAATAPTTEAAPARASAEPPVAPAAPVDHAAALDANETVVKADEPMRRVEAPAATRTEPSIEVTRPRLTLDQRIQADVIELLARNPNLSGKIGVVSEDAVVTLTGYTTTSGQAWRAGRDARGVYGVRHVVNEIRPRVGGITS